MVLNSLMNMKSYQEYTLYSSILWLMAKWKQTRTNVVHKNVNQSYNKVKKSKKNKNVRPFQNIVETFEVTLNLIKNFHFLNVSIHTNFHQNRFINECACAKKIFSNLTFISSVEKIRV